jgi:hypothetical protein
MACPVIEVKARRLAGKGADDDLFFVNSRGGESHACWIGADVIARARGSTR